MRFTPVHHQREDTFAFAQAEAIRLLDGFERALCCRIVVHDRAGLLTWRRTELLLPPERRRHCHPLCLHRRLARPAWNRLCTEHCLVAVNEHARLGEPFLHRCWKGGAELVVPVMLHEHHVLTIFAGMFRGNAPTDAAAARDENVAAIRKKLPKPTARDQADHIRLLSLLGNCLLQLVRPESDIPLSRLEKIRAFLRDRSSQHVSLEDLARDLCLSPGHCSRLVTALLGKPFQEALREERLQRGAVLLRSHDYSVSEIARLVGFESEYHFNRKFKEAFGLPPGAWRRNSENPA